MFNQNRRVDVENLAGPVKIFFFSIMPKDEGSSKQSVS